jgi:DNA adenine methylase
MGFGSAAASGQNTGFRANSNRSGTTPAHDWVNYSDSVMIFAERLQGVVLENRPAIDVIKQHDGLDTLHYIDPPYPHATRSQKRRSSPAYRFEMTDDEHNELAGILRTVDGMVVISGYPCPLYDDELYPDWQRITRRALADGARKRTEVLWISPRAQTCLPMFDRTGKVE